jgi:hypothetical protein
VEFLATHPPTFTEASEPLEADHWLHTVESKLDLLNCTENQKTLFASQQLLGDARAWWASFTATRPANQVQWVEFRDAFHAQHIPVGIMKSKHCEFMGLQQGNQSVYVYSKMFNHLTQYAPEQVDTNEKKKYCFMKGLSTKLQECLALNADWTFLELVSNAIIVDDANRAHQESKKKKKALAASSAVLLTSIGWCVLHITTHHGSIIISWLLVHRRIRMSCLELRRPHRACCTPTAAEEGRGSTHMLQLWSCWSFCQGVYDTEPE